MTGILEVPDVGHLQGREIGGTVRDGTCIDREPLFGANPERRRRLRRIR